MEIGLKVIIECINNKAGEVAHCVLCSLIQFAESSFTTAVELCSHKHFVLETPEIREPGTPMVDKVSA